MNSLMSKLPGSQNGFSLTELAIVLVIVGLLFAMLTPPLSAQIDQRYYNETKKSISEIQEAIIAFAVVNGRLPRPATSATDGIENPSTCSTDAACTGFVPWQTLGTNKTDSFGKIIRYSVTPTYADSSFLLTTAASKKIQSRDASGTLVYIVGSASPCSSTNLCSPAVVYSAGKANFGTLSDGTVLPNANLASTNTDEIANDTAQISFISRTPSSGGGGGEFDDIVSWIPTAILFNRMITASKLP